MNSFQMRPTDAYLIKYLERPSAQEGVSAIIKSYKHILPNMTKRNIYFHLTLGTHGNEDGFERMRSIKHALKKAYDNETITWNELTEGEKVIDGFRSYLIRELSEQNKEHRNQMLHYRDEEGGKYGDLEPLNTLGLRKKKSVNPKSNRKPIKKCSCRKK